MEIGILYVVSTPIGNLEDITLRALRVLKEVDLIAAEDTRTTRKLLTVHNIERPLVVYHEQGDMERASSIMDRLREGKKVALVSEAGTPGISDPGYELITRCLQEGIPVVPVPGPSALIAALSVSGLPTNRFCFEGYLPRKRLQRRKFLLGLRREPRTLIFYESPRRILEALQDCLNILGDRRSVLARELTKRFEDVKRGRLSKIIQSLEGKGIRGEITVVIEGCGDEEVERDALKERIHFLKMGCGLQDRDVIKVVQKETGVSRKIIYKELLRLAKKDGQDD